MKEKSGDFSGEKKKLTGLPPLNPFILFSFHSLNFLSSATIKKLTLELENLKKERLNQMEDREKGKEEVLKMQKKMDEQKSGWDEKRGNHLFSVILINQPRPYFLIYFITPPPLSPSSSSSPSFPFLFLSGKLVAQGAKSKAKVQVLQSELQKALRSKEEFRKEIKELEVLILFIFLFLLSI